ncbi:MAG: hypothetical protein ACRBN8_12660 [Nannocystales bacterium]
MSRFGCIVVALLGLSGCDDEVVGFSEVADAGSSTRATLGSSEGDGTAADGTATSDESSSSGASVEEGLPDFVAYGFEDGLAVSFTDGQTWTEIPELTDMPMREGLARGEERIVLVGADRTATTEDGLTWEVNPFDIPTYARAVAYGAGGFASVGLDHLTWSEDGRSWVDTRGTSTGLDLVAVAYGGGRFLAVGIDRIATSENGQNWTVTEAVGEKLTSVAFGDGRFVAIGELGRILETQDGTTILRDEASGLAGLGGMRFCGDSFVIGGSERYWLSPDAGAWTEVMSIGGGAFACSGTSWVVVKEEGLFWSPELGGFSQTYTPPGVLYEVEFTGLDSL